MYMYVGLRTRDYPTDILAFVQPLTGLQYFEFVQLGIVFVTSFVRPRSKIQILEYSMSFNRILNHSLYIYRPPRKNHPYKVTKCRRTKPFKSAVMVGQDRGKRRQDPRVSIRVSLVIKQKSSEIKNHKMFKLPQSHDPLTHQHLRYAKCKRAASRSLTTIMVPLNSQMCITELLLCSAKGRNSTNLIGLHGVGRFVQTHAVNIISHNQHFSYTVNFTDHNMLSKRDSFYSHARQAYCRLYSWNLI